MSVNMESGVGGQSPPDAAEAQVELVVDGHDISQHIEQFFYEEDRAQWVVYVDLARNDDTSVALQPLNHKKAHVRYRIRSKAFDGPWCSGQAEIVWRRIETGDEDLILHGTGLLHKSPSPIRTPHPPIEVMTTETVSVEGVVVQQKIAPGTISFVEEDPQEKAFREEQIRLAQEAEIRSITRPEFVLFMATSALSSHRLLYELAMSRQNPEVIYSSLIFLPLAIEYFIKYLLVQKSGSIEREYRTHKLLVLFDLLPLDVQRSIEEEFENRLETIRVQRPPWNLRVFLKKTQDAFTALRYLFDIQNARSSRHLVEPENTALLRVTADALERVGLGVQSRQ